MPRPVKRIDPASSPLAGFAVLLQQLRVDAGSPPYRLMAQRTNYSMNALAAAASDRTVPSLAVVRAYVAACDGDVAVWEQRYHKMRDEQRRHKTATAMAGQHSETALAGQSPQSGQTIKNVEDPGLAGAIEPQTDLPASPAPIEQPDHHQIRTAEDFLQALQALRKAAGEPSLRMLEQRTAEAGKRVANSTMSDALRALADGRLPSPHVVEGFVTACGVDATPWLETRKRLAAGGVVEPPPVPETRLSRRRSPAAFTALTIIICLSAAMWVATGGFWRTAWITVPLAATGSVAVAALLALGIRARRRRLSRRIVSTSSDLVESTSLDLVERMAVLAVRATYLAPASLGRPVAPIAAALCLPLVLVVRGVQVDSSPPSTNPPYIAEQQASPTAQRSAPGTAASLATSSGSPTAGSSAGAVGLSAQGANVLTNPSFTGNTLAATTTLMGKGRGAPSAAAGWIAASNAEGSTTTTLRPSDGLDGGTMLHVCAPYDSGVYQSFVGAGNSPVDVSVMIHVASGQVGIGVGNGGATGITKFVSRSDWQTVALTETSQTPATELIIYSTAPAGETSCYDIDFASVQPRQARVPDLSGGMSLRFTNMSWDPAHERSWAINLTRSPAELCPTADPCYRGSTWYAQPEGLESSTLVLTVSRSGSKLTVAASDHGAPPNADQQYTGTDAGDLTFTGTFVERSTGRTADMTLQSCITHPDAPACDLLPKPS